MSSSFDDDFDWAAAVAEIDKACSRHAAPENGVGEPSSTQSRALHQKTLHSFVRGGVRQRSTNVTEERAQDGNGGALDSSRERVGNQSSTGADFMDRQVSSDGAEASSSGCRLPLDYDAAKVWIYPANVPRRSYQFNITKSALFSNTLVCLPTGLGKTLIAAVVIYNYFRWFPTGKIVFTAPSRPLVVQQIEACHKVTGIPQDMTIDMTGQMNPQIRAEHWQSKRVFFVTPQVFEKDIQAGRAATKQIICLVVDEAHRATGNYSYCVVVRELLRAKVEPRILALTATPGSKRITIQAVVDNLQISCLEYRDENDPDVSQYTHNRKIELIEVAMNAESTQVKDVFTEVLQPIVQRLCYFGVFYSREISRLSAYEFLTARDKFRQAPPQALHQSKYQEVETYFGLAITLFHIFKLLITHGMRPAYEMLRQKVEQGVLKRLVRNEKLLQVQDLMKQSIGHGAPSPKLDKVVDVINGHFRVHDATDTRVIIFTNFRESVKDIMDKLAAACESVKAMEFIGQSSGKTSKGQTQKTQQAVLQRFRGGCYNTIVATSIAEEGLDIMEVDLVICFDANISPLRMIQRMGRTGRKRDGRVVVLASGGSEVQGYLKKQSKSKALGKHMLNGGLHSFNFHESHRMIPHSLRTAVQVVELAIEDFVPRGRKLKEKDTKALGPRKLTEKELEIVKLVTSIPDLEPHIRGGPEDPANRFFASPVYQIKHSRRSCLLMDCLQTLGVPGHLTSEERISRDNVTSPWPTQLPLESKIAGAVNEIQLPTSPLCENLSDGSGHDLDPKWAERVTPICVLPSSSVSSPDLSMRVEAFSKDLPSPKEVPCEQRHHEGLVARNTISSSNLDSLELTNNSGPCPDHKEQADGDFDHLESPQLTPIANKDSTIDHTLPGDPKAKVAAPAARQHRSVPLSDHAGVEYNETFHQLHGTGPHRWRYSTGVVSVTQSGLVSIDSPPSLLQTREVNIRGLTKPSDQRDTIRVNAETLRPRQTEPNHNTEQRQTAEFSPLPSTLANQSSDHTLELVAATPDEKVEYSSSKQARLQKGAIQTRVLGFDELSPRLAEFANKGVVPSTPRKERTAVSGKVLVPSILATYSTEGAPFHPSDGQPHISTTLSILNNLKPPMNPISRLPSSSIPTGRTPQQITGLTPLSASTHFAEDAAPQQRTLTHRKARPLIFDHLNTENVPPLDVCMPVVKNGSTSPNLEETLQPALDHSKRKARSPLQIRSSKSSGEDWQMNGGEALGSVQKPRKLKRLRRACEKLPASSAEESLRGNHDSSVLIGRANHQRKLAARAFIDEEAEVSSDDEDDDLSGKDNSEDEDSSLQGFIDTAATQHLNGSVDLINIYRKSLLTPSPLGCPGGKQINLQQRNATQSCDVTPSSIEPSSASRGLEDELSDFSSAPNLRRSSWVRPPSPIQTTRILDLETDAAKIDGNCRAAVATNTALCAQVEELDDQDRKPALDNSKRKATSPLQIPSSKSSGEDWQMNGGEALGSVQKPRKLKRLRRACEKLPASSSEESLRGNHDSSAQDQVRSKVHHPRLGIANHQRKLAARAFIDEEAEVSSDDEDDDLSGKDNSEDEEDSSLQGFIDTAATQHLNGSVDMINVYRKSLLTPSPLGYRGVKQINLQQLSATPSFDVTPSSIEPSSASRGLEDELSDFSSAPSVRRSSFVRPPSPIQTTRILDLKTDAEKSEGNCRAAVSTYAALGAQVEGLDDQDRKKPEFRKRKLSFQTSPTYEDDLFEGVDLDALEAEAATEISRLRTEAQVISSNNTLQGQVVPRSGSLPSRHPKDNEFQFIPSFDLGLGN